MLCMQDFLTSSLNKMCHLGFFFLSLFGHTRSQDIPGAKCSAVLSCLFDLE